MGEPKGQEQERAEEPPELEGQELERAEKRPQPEEDVPGVRGPARPVEEEGSAPEAPPSTTWGSEGGAGAYPGAPVVSRTPEPEEAEDADAEPTSGER